MATEKGGGKLDVLQGRFRASRSPAMVCVEIPFLGAKLSQYVLGDLDSLLANPQSYGSAKQLGCTDDARKALETLEFPSSEGGRTSLLYRMGEKMSV